MSDKCLWERKIVHPLLNCSQAIGIQACLTHTHTHTHTHTTHLYQRLQVLLSEVVTSTTSQQSHKPWCIVMATVCHSERRDNKAPNKYKYQKHAYCSKYQINLILPQKCVLMFGGRWENSEKLAVAGNQAQGPPGLSCQSFTPPGNRQPFPLLPFPLLPRTIQYFQLMQEGMK